MLLKIINKNLTNKNPKQISYFFNNRKNQNKHDIVIIGAGCVGQGVADSFLHANKNNRIFLIPLTVIFGKNLGYLRTYYEPLINEM